MTLDALYASHLARLSKEIAAALAEHELDALIVSAGKERLVSPFDDRYFPFSPTPTFAHITPVAEPGAALVIEPGKPIGLHRVRHESYWDAPPPTPPSWALAPLREVSPDDAPGGRVAFIGDELADLADWNASASALNPSGLIAALAAIRAIKSEYEVQSMAEANRIAAAGHDAISRAFAAGDKSELALHLEYLAATGQDDVETPYKGIVALGRNAAVLHHNRYGREPRGDDGRSMLVDAGAKVRGYAADVTRTHVKGGASSARFAELIAAIDSLQQKVCARVAPGLSFEVLHDETHELLAGAVRDLDIASASCEELIESGFTRALFPHGLGHSIGIQVHDVGCKIKPPAERNPSLRNTADVTVGHVFTVEPGCYFIDSLLSPLRESAVAARVNWRLVDELRPFGGIRIEDNLAVGAEETRNLTRDNWPSSP